MPPLQAIIEDLQGSSEGLEQEIVERVNSMKHFERREASVDRRDRRDFAPISRVRSFSSDQRLLVNKLRTRGPSKELRVLEQVHLEVYERAMQMKELDQRANWKYREASHDTASTADLSLSAEILDESPCSDGYTSQSEQQLLDDASIESSIFGSLDRSESDNDSLPYSLSSVSFDPFQESLSIASSRFHTNERDSSSLTSSRVSSHCSSAQSSGANNDRWTVYCDHCNNEMKTCTENQCSDCHRWYHKKCCLVTKCKGCSANKCPECEVFLLGFCKECRLDCSKQLQTRGRLGRGLRSVRSFESVSDVTFSTEVSI